MRKPSSFALPLLLSTALLASACPAPGEGEKAEAGYATCAPVLEALENFHADAGSYPAALEELVPRYLTELPGEVNGYPLEYRRAQESFSLEFRYEGPGMNVCAFTPEAQWRCHGYY